MAEIIHVKQTDDGQVRVTLDEPIGDVQAHTLVMCQVPGNKRDHAGMMVRTMKDGSTTDVPYDEGDAAEDVRVYLSGQTQFFVPAGTTAIQFEDGSSFNIGSGSNASAESDKKGSK